MTSQILSPTMFNEVTQQGREIAHFLLGALIGFVLGYIQQYITSRREIHD